MAKTNSNTSSNAAKMKSAPKSKPNNNTKAPAATPGKRDNEKLIAELTATNNILQDNIKVLNNRISSFDEIIKNKNVDIDSLIEKNKGLSATDTANIEIEKKYQSLQQVNVENLKKIEVLAQRLTDAESNNPSSNIIRDLNNQIQEQKTINSSINQGLQQMQATALDTIVMYLSILDFDNMIANSSVMMNNAKLRNDNRTFSALHYLIQQCKVLKNTQAAIRQSQQGLQTNSNIIMPN